MMLIAHIAIALASLAWTSYLLIAPSRRKIQAGYGLVAATLASGAYLVSSTGAPMMSACLSGLFYTSLVSLGLARAHHKLAAQKI